MKIAYVHQYFKRPTDVGSSRSFEQARRMVQAGHEVHIITSDLTRDGGVHAEWVTEEVDGIHVHWYPNRYDNRMNFRERLQAFARFAAVSTWRTRSIRPDLVFATSTPLTVAIPGILATVLPRRPLVFEVRDLWPELPIAMGALSNPVLRWIAVQMEQIVYAHSEKIVALSPGMTDSIRRKVEDPDSVVTVPNASDVDLFEVDPELAARWRRESLTDIPTTSHIALYAGTVGVANDVGFLVNVAGYLQKLSPKREAVILVMGDGAELDQVREKAGNLGVLGETFFVHPPVPKQDIPLAYAASRVALSVLADIPLLQTSSPNKVFDGFAAGRPVVTNYGGWIADTLKESKAGVSLEGRDPQAFAQQLLRIAGDDKLFDSMAESSLSLGRFTFDRNRLASIVLKSVEEAARTFGSGKWKPLSRLSRGGRTWVR